MVEEVINCSKKNLEVINYMLKDINKAKNIKLLFFKVDFKYL